jgi:hypothetical protein
MKKNIEQKELTLIYDACLHLRLISDFEIINKKIAFMSELSSEDFLPLNQKLRSYQECMIELADNKELNKNIGNSGIYSSFSELITDMQFHDVIQQRLSHIKELNLAIINELTDFSYDIPYSDKTKYIKILPLLAKINMVQIQVINHEYREVIENLKKVLSSIDQLVKLEASTVFVYYFNNASLFNVLTDTICTKLKSISEIVFPEAICKTIHSAEEISYVQKIYTMKTERDVFNKIVESISSGEDINTLKDIIIKELKNSVSDSKLELF